MSARRRAKAPPAPIAADVLAAAGRAHAAACAALRAVQLPDAADALEAEGAGPCAGSPASETAILSLSGLDRGLRRAHGAAEDDLIQRRRAIPDDLYRDDARAVVDAERADVLARYLPLARAVDAARACVSAAASARRWIHDAEQRSGATRSYWLACGLREAAIALDCARDVEVRS